MSEPSQSSPIEPKSATASQTETSPLLQNDYELVPAEIVDGEVVISPDAANLMSPRPIMLAVHHSNTSINTTVRSITYPLGYPPPDFLELAEKHHPGATKEIFDGFKIEQSHRHFLEKQAQSADINMATIGLATGALMLASVVLASLYMFMQGNITGGTSALGLTGVIGLLGYFIRLSRAKPEDLSKIPEPKPPSSTSSEKRGTTPQKNPKGKSRRP